MDLLVIIKRVEVIVARCPKWIDRLDVSGSGVLRIRIPLLPQMDWSCSDWSAPLLRSHWHHIRNSTNEDNDEWDSDNVRISQLIGLLNNSYHIGIIQPAKGLHAESARAVTGRRCPHSGEGEDFLTGQLNFFRETAVTPERKVEKSFPMWEINRHAEG